MDTYLRARPDARRPDRVVNDVSRADDVEPHQQSILVLDDYHVITAPEVHETLTYLLEHTRSNCACWSPPGPTRHCPSRGCGPVDS